MARRGSRSAHTPAARAKTAKGSVSGGHHQADLGKAAAGGQHGEGQRHEGDAVAHQRQRLPGEQEAKLGLFA